MTLPDGWTLTLEGTDADAVMQTETRRYVVRGPHDWLEQEFSVTVPAFPTETDVHRVLQPALEQALTAAGAW